MGAPKNFYNAVDLAKFGLEDLEKKILPKVSAADNGKVAKVIDGKWALGDDVNTPKVRYINATFTEVDNIPKVVLPEGVTVMDIYNMILSGIEPLLVFTTSNTTYVCRCSTYNFATYQSTDYCILTFESINYGARKKIDGVYTYYYMLKPFVTFSSYYNNTESIDYSAVHLNTTPKAIFSGTLTAGETTVEITNNSLIKSDALVDVYTDVFGVDPTDVVVTNGKVTLTFPVQATDINIRIEVSV